MSDKLRLYILTDTHYVSPRLWEEGKPINDREKGDQIALKCTPQIMDTFFDKIIADKDTPHVLITGDLVNNGTKIGHEDFRKALKKLTDAGKKVYVVPATHDYCGENENGDENIFHATRYTATGSEPTERVSRPEIDHLYDDFGPNYADSIDSESFSYSLTPEKGYRLIVINDNGNGRSHCGLFEEGFKWLKGEIEKAKEKGERVMLAVHHPVLPPWEIYRQAADFECFGGYEELKKLMCETGVRVVFTGHTHVQNISRYEDEKGRYFYDVATTALPSAAGKMRLVECTDDVCRVSSIGIETINGVDTKGLSAYEYIYGLNFGGAFENAFPYAGTDWDKFVEGASGLLGGGLLNDKKKLMQKGMKFLGSAKMSLVAKLGGKNCGLSKDEKKALKNVNVTEVLFNILRHVFPGNGVYTPETAEFKALDGVLKRADKLLDLIHFDRNKFVGGMGTLEETAIPFLYNNRTGDDDNLTFNLR